MNFTFTAVAPAVLAARAAHQSCLPRSTAGTGNGLFCTAWARSFAAARADVVGDIARAGLASALAR